MENPDVEKYGPELQALVNATVTKTAASYVDILREVIHDPKTDPSYKRGLAKAILVIVEVNNEFVKRASEEEEKEQEEDDGGTD